MTESLATAPVRATGPRMATALLGAGSAAASMVALLFLLVWQANSWFFYYGRNWVSSAFYNNFFGFNSMSNSFVMPGPPLQTAIGDAFFASFALAALGLLLGVLANRRLRSPARRPIRVMTKVGLSGGLVYVALFILFFCGDAYASAGIAP